METFPDTKLSRHLMPPPLNFLSYLVVDCWILLVELRHQILQVAPSNSLAHLVSPVPVLGRWTLEELSRDPAWTVVGVVRKTSSRGPTGSHQPVK